MNKHIVFVLFGITWDLAKRKILPAFYNIFSECVNEDCSIDIIGVGRKDFDNKDFQEYISEDLKNFISSYNQNKLNILLDALKYCKINFADSDSYEKIRDLIPANKEVEVVYYLSTPPQLFTTIVKSLKEIKLNMSNSRIVFEKPFGTSLDSAKNLNTEIRKVFKEEQIYRIDHYLWKDVIQNIAAFRFSNMLFEPIWNNHYIDNIQITVSEKLWVEDRWDFYDKSWALRDMVQNHLMQVIALIAMEAPYNLDADAIKNKKVEVLKALRLDDNFAKSVVYGQYEWYQQENWVKENSQTETFVALKLFIDNWRFEWVPFYLRTWKNLKEKVTRIVVEFKKLPNILFNKNGELNQNRIVIEIYPKESISVEFNIKEFGQSDKIKTVKSIFTNKEEWLDAYSKLITDIIKWESTLFTRWDFIEESWKLVDNLVECKYNCPLVHKYKPWTSGPDSAFSLIEKDGRKWFN